jgi:heme A synthase
VSKRSRIAAFGAAGLLIVLGAIGAAVISGGTGQVVAMVLIGIGLVAVVSLIFYEVGLSEDAERAREERRATSATTPSRTRQVRVPRGGRVKPRLKRDRGERRRLDRDDR